MLWRMLADLHRERIGMMFIRIDAATGPARSMVAAATTRTDWRRLVRGRQMSGGKGAKGGNLESLGNTGLADGGATGRNRAGTGGNWRKLSAVVLSHPRGAVQFACGNCGNWFPRAPARSLRLA